MERRGEIPQGMNLQQGIIVGHPGGGPKCISIVQFKPGDFGDLEQHYPQQGTRQGSSSSPVLVDARLDVLSPRNVYALHYHAGAGINIRHVIDTISDQAIHNLEEHGSSMQVPPD